MFSRNVWMATCVTAVALMVVGWSGLGSAVAPGNDPEQVGVEAVAEHDEWGEGTMASEFERGEGMTASEFLRVLEEKGIMCDAFRINSRGELEVSCPPPWGEGCFRDWLVDEVIEDASYSDYTLGRLFLEYFEPLARSLEGRDEGPAFTITIRGPPRDPDE
jgi:hypothetical protein